MMIDPHRLALALVGFSAFLQLYTPQSLLPIFAAEFRAGPAAVGLLVSATTLAVALVAPFAGAVADVIGRRRIIVGAVFILAAPTALLATAGSLEELIIWRFVQGLLLPPIFAVAVAYIGEEWPAGEVGSVIGVYMSGSALGGFLGRLISGWIAEHFGWRAAFLSLAAIDVIGAAVIARYLPTERKFVAAESFAASLRAMGRHLVNAKLLTTFAFGFAILFSFVAIFTYVNFHLAAPPYSLSPGALGSIFIVYLLGVVVVPWSGRVIKRFGRRRVAVGALALWALSLLLTLVPSLTAVVAGLAFAAATGFVVQALATGVLATASGTGRSAAVGLYATAYYIGGSAGGVAPSLAYAAWGWPGCVALVIAVLAAMAAAILAAWREERASTA